MLCWKPRSVQPVIFPLSSGNRLFRQSICKSSTVAIAKRKSLVLPSVPWLSDLLTWVVRLGIDPIGMLAQDD